MATATVPVHFEDDGFVVDGTVTLRLGEAAYINGRFQAPLYVECYDLSVTRAKESQQRTSPDVAVTAADTPERES